MGVGVGGWVCVFVGVCMCVSGGGRGFNCVVIILQHTVIVSYFLRQSTRV